MIVATSHIFGQNVFYVDVTNGNDSNAGLSEAIAWQTIAKVNSSSFSPGDKILFKRGEIWREQLIISSSGNAENPITFGAYASGADPIINGSDLVTGWILYSTNVWQTICTTEAHNVWFNGTRGNEKPSLANVNSTNDWYWNSNVLYVYSTSDPDTAYTSPGIESQSRGYSIYVLSKYYINIENFHVEKSKHPIGLANTNYINVDSCTLTHGSSATYIDNSDNTLFNNCTVSYFYYESGYADGGGIGFHVGDSANLIISNNTISYCDAYGIAAVTANVTGGRIYGNTIHHCAIGSSLEPYGIFMNGTNFNVYQNEIYSCGDTGTDQGIHTAGFSCNFYQNKIHDNIGMGMWVKGNNNKMYYNLIYDNSTVGFRFGGAGTSTHYAYNNTVYGNNSYGFYFEAVPANSHNHMKNNIVAENGTYEVYVTDNGVSGFDGNYNCIYHSSGAAFMYWKDRAYNWADWKTNTSQDENSISSTPLFIDSANDNFTLQAASPCINVGTNVSLSQDYVGNIVPYGGGVDIGAYEFTLSPLYTEINAFPTSGWVPLNIDFTGSATGGTEPYTYSWDFGDDGSSSAQNPSHTYTNAGTFNVILTVTDAQSSNASDSITITASSISSYQLAVSAATGSPAPGTGGITDPSPGIYSYSYGNSVQVEAIPNESYRFSKWTGDVSDSEAYNKEVNITMDKDKSISAFFCTKCGDVTGDLSITPADAQAAFEIFLGIISNPTESEKENADVDCSGTKTEPDITPGDAQAIFEKFLGINDLPCDCSCNSRSGSVLTQMRLTPNRQTPDINLIINDIRVDQGGEVIVPIIVDNPFNIKAFGFDLIFPSEALEFVGVERTEPLDDLYQVDAIKIADGVVRAGGYRSKPIMSHSPRALITLIFKVIEEAEGLCHFSIVNTTDDIENASFNNEKIIKRIWEPRNIPEENVRIR